MMMKKMFILCLIGVIFYSCASISGIMNDAGHNRGYHSKIVNNQKKVSIILNNIKKKEIKHPVGKPISPKKVLYFNEPSIPEECIPIGYIAIYNENGLDNKKKIGYIMEKLKEKAASLGVSALNDFINDLTSAEITLLNVKTKNPYVRISYSKSKYTVIGTKSIWERCPQENKCNKYKKNYEDYKWCVRSCFNNRPAKINKIIYYAVTAMKCDPNYLNRLRNGENIDAIKIERKIKTLFGK